MNERSERDVIVDLNVLYEDKRLSRIFKEKNKTCLLNLWILEIEDSGVNFTKLLYGLIIPSTMPSNDTNLKKWFSPHPLPNFKTMGKDNSYKFRITKLSYFDEGQNILKIIKGLCNGNNLKDSSLEINVLKEPVSPYDKFKISDSPGKVNEFFIIRPVIFLETNNTIERFIDQRKPLKSPIHDSPAFMGSIFRLKKLDIFSNNGIKLPFRNELIKFCLKLLENDLGLNFKSSDSPRLGNIEFLCFTAADDHEISNIIYDRILEEDIKHNVHSKKAVVKIINENLTGQKILVRCRLRSAEEIILDMCKESFFTDEYELNFYFEAEEEFREILITVWKRKYDHEPWEILYENNNVNLNGVVMNSHLIGLHGRLKTDLTDSIKTRDPEIKKRKRKIEELQQSHFDGQSKISIFEYDPWVPYSDEIRVFTRRLFPKSSSGKFFPSDWGQKSEGILSFIEWIDSLTSDNSNDKIIIFDPYFSSLGVYLISKANYNKRYLVYTTRLKKEDYINSNTAKIKRKCSELGYLLSNIDLHIFEIIGKERYFHDRYILIYDNTDKIKKGYHLSNSIQTVTMNYPLLVTPIPFDLLDKVDNYVNNLINEVDSSGTAELIKVFPFNNPIKKVPKIGIPNAVIFFKELLQNNAIVMLNKEQLFDVLSVWGIIRNGRFILDEDILDYSDNFIQRLIKSSDSNFEKLWVAFCEWLALTDNSEDYLNKIFNSNYLDKLVQKLINLLLNVHKSKFFLDYNTKNIQTLNFAHLIPEKDFYKLLYEVNYDVKMGPRFRWPQINSIKYSSEVLINFDHRTLINSISNVISSLKYWNSTTPEYRIKICVLVSMFSVLLSHLIEHQNRFLIKDLLVNEIPIFRAIGAYDIIIYSSNFNYIFSTLIKNLDKKENIHVLAELIHNLRSNINRFNYKKIENDISIIFKEMSELWSSNINNKELRRINRRLDGPGEVYWAIQTTNKLLLILMENDKLSMNNIAQLWFEILFERLKLKKEKQLFFIKTKEGYNVDGEFINICGYLIAKLDKKYSQKYIKELIKIKNHNQRLLKKPFQRSIDYLSWVNVISCLLWIQTIFNCARLYSDDKEFRKISEEIEELWIYANRKEFQINIEPLITFASDIKEKLK